MSLFNINTLCIVIFAMTLQQYDLTLACSSRTLTKSRPSTTTTAAAKTGASITTTTTISTTSTTTTTTPRPNITFPTEKCPSTYDTWYCLNDATCFAINIGNSVMYNCECAVGFMGPRCEFKELDGSYSPKRPMLEKASIASGATCALLFMLLVCLTLYLRYDERTKFLEYDTTSCCNHCDDQRCCGGYEISPINNYYSNLLAVGSYVDDDMIKVQKHELNFNNYLFQQMDVLPPLGFAFKRSTKL